MATLNSARSFATVTSGARPASILTRAFGTVSAWNDARATRKALTQLTARELDDIGLVAGDIDDIVGNIVR